MIAACTHPDCVRALFSATLPEAVEGLARSVLKDPLRITVGERNTGEGLLNVWRARQQGVAGGGRAGWRAGHQQGTGGQVGGIMQHSLRRPLYPNLGC